jgi:3,5-epimerase/4-reductase
VVNWPSPRGSNHATGNGWVAGHLKELLQKQGKDVETTTVRMEEREAVLRVLNQVKPTHVLNAAGCTGRPNVDWCEDNREATMRSNVVGTMNLADCCFLKGIHCTVFATGCIYHYDEKHPIGGPGFTEEDEANFTGSFYSLTKGKVEAVRFLPPSHGCCSNIFYQMIKHYPNVLILRLRMPVSDDLHPRNFVTKITNYQYVVDIPNVSLLKMCISVAFGDRD